jgi:hypothetical protein
VNVLNICDQFMARLREVAQKLNEEGEYEAALAVQQSLVVLDDMVDKLPSDCDVTPSIAAQSLSGLKDQLQWLKSVPNNSSYYHDAQLTATLITGLPQHEPEQT